MDALKWFIVAPEVWLTLAFVVVVAINRLVSLALAGVRRRIGAWRHRRTSWPRQIAMLLVGALFTGCATTYRPAGGVGPFDFVLTPEQVERLKEQRRKYAGVQEVSSYATGAGLVCTGVALGFTDSKHATAICTGVSAVAEGTSIFAASQVKAIDAELAAGGAAR